MNYLRGNISIGMPRCLVSEGGIGKGGGATRESESTNNAIQATSQSGAITTNTGQGNSGLSVTNSGFGSNTINVSDQGAVDRAFTFGENVVTVVGKILANESATQAATVTANSDFLAAQTELIASNSAGGATAAQNKTILYVVGAAILAVVAIIFLRR